MKRMKKNKMQDSDGTLAQLAFNIISHTPSSPYPWAP